MSARCNSPGDQGISHVFIRWWLTIIQTEGGGDRTKVKSLRVNLRTLKLISRRDRHAPRSISVRQSRTGDNAIIWAADRKISKHSSKCPFGEGAAGGHNLALFGMGVVAKKKSVKNNPRTKRTFILLDIKADL